MDDAVHDGGEWGEEVGGVDFRVEEDFGGEEALVADVHGDAAPVRLGDRVPQKAIRLVVEAGELLDDVGAHVAVLFLDLSGRFEARVWFASVSQEGLYEVGDVSTGNGDAFDRTANDISFRYWYDVRYAISGINDRAGERSIGDFGRCP